MVIGPVQHMISDLFTCLYSCPTLACGYLDRDCIAIGSSLSGLLVMNNFVHLIDALIQLFTDVNVA